jgi:hypothetical protein
MVERQFSKLLTRVRFPSPAPFSFNNLHSCAGKVQENWVFFKLFFAQNVAGCFLGTENEARGKSVGKLCKTDFQEFAIIAFTNCVLCILGD